MLAAAIVGRQVFTRIGKRHGLRWGELRVLASVHFIQQAGQRVTYAHLLQALAMTDRPGVHAHVTALEGRGLLKQSKATTKGRAVLMQVTAAGEGVIGEVERALRATIAKATQIPKRVAARKVAKQPTPTY